MRLLAIGAFLFMMSSQIQFAQATGCGGPEFFLKETTVISSHPFSEFSKNHDVYLHTNLHGPVRLMITFYFPLLGRPKQPSFTWHELDLKPNIPTDVTIQEIEALLKNPETKIDFVQDRFDVECTNEYNPETLAKNLRIILPYKDKVLEFRTPYLPVVRW